MKRALLAFAALTVVYHSNLRPVASGDSLPASLIPIALWLDGTTALDRFGPWAAANIPYAPSVIVERNGHRRSVYPVAGPVLAAPLYWPVAAVPRFGEQPPGTLIAVARILEKVAAAAIAAVGVLVLSVLLRRIAGERVGWVLTAVFALGTGLWSTASQAMWQHTFGVPLIAGALLAAGRRWWLAGLLAGLAIAVRPTNLALVPALAAALWAARAKGPEWLAAMAGPVFGVGVVAIYNLSVFGQLTGGYSAALGANPLTALAGLLASPGRGLLIYTPVSAFAAAAWMRTASESRKSWRPQIAMAAVLAAGQLAMVSLWAMWWGGYSWGPRLLTEILPAVMVLIAAGWQAIDRPGWRHAFAAAAVYGCLIQALGVYFYPKGHWDHTPVSVDTSPRRLWDWRDNPIARTAAAGPAWEPFSILWAAARGGVPAASRRMQELGVRPN